MILGPETDRILAEIEQLVTGSVSPPETTRALATLVFLDVVGSTERAESLGDRAWGDLLQSFYDLCERELASSGGIEVDRAGDGLLARFDGPTRAIRAARSLQDQAAELGLPLRAGGGSRAGRNSRTWHRRPHRGTSSRTGRGRPGLRVRDGP